MCELRVGHQGIISFAQATKNFKNFWKWFGDDIRIFILAKNFVSMRGDIPYAYDPIVIKFIGKPILPEVNRRDFFVANMAGVISNTNAIQREHPTPKPQPTDCRRFRIAKPSQQNALEVSCFGLLVSPSLESVVGRVTRSWIVRFGNPNGFRHVGEEHQVLLGGEDC